MASIGGVCVDRYEAFLVYQEPALGEVIHPHVERPQHGVHYAAKSAAGVLPQAYISRVEAAAACANAGKRLCTLSEWQRACQGQKRWTYPYGASHRAGACNSGKPHLLSKMFGSDHRIWTYELHFNNPRLNQEPGFLAKTAEYEGCASEDGIYDMVGNLHEWVSDTVTAELRERLAQENVRRRSQPAPVGNGIFMGGFYSTTSEHGPGCKFITTAHEPTYHDYSTGFRCCQSTAAPKHERVSPQ